MYVWAFSVGCAVPRTDFDAAVHSVFDSVANLKPSGQSLLLTLLVSAEGDLPQGIRFHAPAAFGFQALLVGMRATCRDGVVSLEDFALTIDLRKARRWESNLLSLQPDMNDPAVRAAWQCAWQALNRRQLRCGSDMVAGDLAGHPAKEKLAWIQRMRHFMHAILSATARYDLEATRAMESLIGLGPGLTPSGDDLIAGYLLGLWCCTKGQAERLRFVSDLGKAATCLLDHTNDISRTYLFHAANGQASSRLTNLATAICSGADSTLVLERAETAMRVGHTSGMDAVTGLLFGLAAWDAAYLWQPDFS